MRARQREAGVVVVEGRRLPYGRGVTPRTIMTEVPGDVVRVGCPVKVCRMALVTICIDQLIIAVRMARLALDGNVCACQREARGIVIECRRSPVRRGVALRAIMVEVPRDVVRVRRPVEVRRMALIAIGVHQLVVPVGVACRALHGNMRTCQREARSTMIERRRVPVGRRMTLRAIMVEVTRDMVRVRRPLEIGLMALIAIGIHQLVVAVGVACRALHGDVRTRQREARGTMIECRRVPVGRRVTLRAIMVEIAADVVRVCRLLEIRLVTLVAVRVRQLVVAVGVARLALHRNVCPCQREPCRIMIKCRRGPGGRGMALRTVVAEVPGRMVGIERGRKDILMTTEAIHRFPGKHIVSMAARALEGHVSARERKTGQSRVIVSCTGPVCG